MRHSLLALALLFSMGANPSGNMVETNTTFAHLRPLVGKGTEALFNDPAASQAINALAGASAYEELLKVTQVAPEMTLHGDRFLKASGCMPHACNLAGAMVVIDTKSTDILIVLYPISLELEQNVFINNPKMDLPRDLDKEITVWKARYWQMK
jgi:hypothetical protein